MPAGTASFNFLISITLYLGLIATSSFGWQITMVCFPLVFALQTVFAIGLAQILSVLQVFFRDVQQIVSIAFQLWFWATPIVYLKSSVSADYRWVYKLNPFDSFATIYHKIFIFQSWPTSGEWLTCGLLAFVTFVLGAIFVTRFAPEIPDEI